jgi:putative peptide zinc metalloprotease protein
MLNGLSKVKLKLSIQKKINGSYVIGSKVNNVFIEVPEEALAILEYCNGTNTIDQIKNLLLKDKNMDIDVLDFIQTLYSINLIYSIDGEKCNIGEETKYPSVLITISKLLFNKHTAFVYGGLFIVNCILIITNSRLFPRPKDAFFIRDKIGFNMIVFFLISWTITFIHELGHFLSVVRLNIGVKFNLSLRLIWLVVEADINGLWSVPNKNRYFSYFAGVCFETVIMFISLVLKLANLNSITSNITSIIILVLTLNFLWQFMIFLRTDFYLVLLTVFDLSGLHSYSKIYIKNKLTKNKYNNELEDLSSAEITRVKLFCLTYILGLIFCCIRLLYEIPISINILYKSALEILSYDIMNIIDGVLILAVILISALLWLKGAINKIKSSKLERNV